jgi:hypothetical protein
MRQKLDVGLLLCERDWTSLNPLCSSSRLILHHHVSSDSHHKYLMMRHWQRHTRKGEALKIHPGRSWHHVHSTSSSPQHPVHLWVIDVSCGGRWRSQDAAPRVNTSTPCAGTWTSSIFSSHLICIRRCLLRSRSLCRTLYPHRQTHLGYSDHDIYPLAIGWSIKLVLIDNIPWSRFVWWLPWDRDEYLWGLCWRRSPYLHGSRSGATITQQLQ